MDLEQTQHILDSYPVLIGIDWADDQHVAWELNTESREGEETKLENTPSAIVEWLGEIKNRYDADQVLICMEKNETNLKHTLSIHGWVELAQVAESKLTNFRKTFSPSGAKDDPTDAGYLVEMYLHHPDQFEKQDPDRTDTRSLDHYARKRRKLVDKRGDQVNTLTSELKKYFPQALELTGSSLTTMMAVDFLQNWPTLKQAKQEDPETIRQFYHDHNVRGEAVQERIRLIREAEPVTDDPAVIDPLKMTVKALAGSIREFTKMIKKFDKDLDETFKQHEDSDIWSSFPRAGTQMAPRLLAAFGDDRSSWEDASEMQTYSGMAPVTVESGKSSWVHWRWGAPNFLKQTFFEYAHQSIRESTWASAFYEKKRSSGDDHQTAVRKLAFKWIRIMYRCWKDREPYSEKTYLKALLRSGSDVIDYVEKDLSALKKKVI